MKTRIAIALSVLLLGVKISSASDYAVGTCRPSLPSFATISEAVATVPLGATVLVCPGTYAEQVNITTPLTLSGVASGDSDRPIIVPPATGMVVNASSSALGESLAVAAQVLVTAGPVNISNITVDGTGNNLSGSAFLAGIFYGAGGSGTVNHVTARNQTDANEGTGLWAENDSATATSVTFENSSVYNSDDVGVNLVSTATPASLTVTVKGNTVSSNLNGILVDGVLGSVSDNVVTDTIEFGTTTGFGGIIAVSTGAAPASVTGNTVADSINGGITAFLNGTGVVVTSNTVLNTQAALGAVEASGVTFQSNKISMASIGIEFNCLPSTASGNTISDVTTGLNDVPLDFSPGTNTYDNVDSLLNQTN
jgi:hypothetical protein